jgi:sugar phosphate isomerase/epimerase
LRNYRDSCMTPEISRRSFTRLALASIPGLAAAPYAFADTNKFDYDTIGGIQFGVESFSFHELPHGNPEVILPLLIQDMRAVGLREVELLHTHIEPFGDNPSMNNFHPREDVRKWRLAVPLDYYAKVRHQFESQGMRIYYYDITPDESFTDAEIDRTFQAARAMGAVGIGTSSKLSEARRLVPAAEKSKMQVVMHNHNAICDPDQLATVESLEKVLAMSGQFAINLDLGHFAAGNNDAVDFIRKHATRTPLLHVRDRKKNDGRYVPCGEGDAKIAEVMRLIRDNKYPIRAYIEYEYGSYRTPVEEVRRCLDYCKQALA